MQYGENLIGAVPGSHMPTRTQVIQNSFKYATWQNIRSEVYGGSKNLQMNVNPSQLRIVESLSASNSVIDFQFGSNISVAAYELGLSSQDSFVPTGIAIKFGVVSDIAAIGNETLVQTADTTEFATGSAAIQAFLSGTFEFQVAGQETIYIQAADVLDFGTYNETTGAYQLGGTKFHELLKTIKFSGNEVNTIRFKANGAISAMEANSTAMLVLDGFVIRRNATAVTRQA
jgi:hypothetical protein